MQIKLPKHASEIIRKLHANGYEAYVVGGCVRDSILGRNPHDWDITTSARPEEVKALFYRTIDTGLKHGTVTVLIDKEPYEITTYRSGDRFNEDAPEQITYADSLIEDLEHRDFTINAMAYNDTEGLVDIFGGVDDINRKVIRCVGYADERIDEDPLRMLRAIRFAGQLNFSIEACTHASILKKCEQLKVVSAERIREELMKLLVSDHPEKLLLAYEAGLTKVFLPEFDLMMDTPQNNPHHMYNVGEHTIHAIMAIKADPVLRLTMLLHDVAKPACRTTDSQGIDHFYGHYDESVTMSKQIMKRLKCDNKTINTVMTLIRYHDVRFKDPLTTGKRDIRRTMHLVTRELSKDLLLVMNADVLAQSSYYQREKLEILKEAEKACDEIIKAKDCLTLKELKINGNQLINAGITDGKIIGSILNTLLSMVIENPELNHYLYLKELAFKIYNQIKE